METILSRPARTAATCGTTIIVVALVVAAGIMTPPAARADVLKDQLHRTRIQQAQDKQQLAKIDKQSASLQKSIDALTEQIRSFDAPIHQLDLSIQNLADQSAHRATRIAQLQRQFVQQRSEIVRLNQQTVIARNRLAQRLVALYKHDDVGMAGILTGDQTIEDILNRQESASRVALSENSIVNQIGQLQLQVRLQRARNHDVQRELRTDIARLNGDAAKLASDRQQLATQQARVNSLRANRDAVMRQLSARQTKLENEIDSLEEDSKALKEAIQTGATTFSGSVPVGASPTGVAWPVSGPIVSPFGPRWGRMHEGVDIAATTGTPIHAAATGIVTYAGWMSGYGNMVIIQHAGVLSTGYGHQSRLGTHVGQFVQQGQIIGFVGCTGHCFGPHVHFETRISTEPVDPMRYL